MKIVSQGFLFIVFSTLCSAMAFAQCGGGGENPCPDSPDGGPTVLPPPGLSIDKNIFILFSVAILFGIYIVYRNNIKTKNPI
jgi:hypothetical protein